MSSAFELDMMSDDIAHLAPAIRLCMGAPTAVKMSRAHYWSQSTMTDGESCLIFYWTEPSAHAPSTTGLPAPLGADEVAIIAKAWLETAPRGKEPDIDGDVGKGFRISTVPPGENECGLHGSDSWTVLFAITTEWAEYHK